MEKNNKNVLAWISLVVAVIALGIVYFNSVPQLAPLYQGQFKVTKVTNTDPSLNCNTLCTQQGSKSFCVGSGFERVVNLYTYFPISTSGGACGGTPVQFISDSNILFATPGNLGIVDECAATGALGLSQPSACNILQLPTTGLTGSYGIAYQETASGPTYCECARLL